MKPRFSVLTVLAVGLFAAAACNPPAPPPPPPPPASAPTAPAAPSAPATAPAPPSAPTPPAKGKRLIASLETTKGLIQFEMMPDLAPKACENFKVLANRGFYNKLIFHRVIRDFMIQGGDPDGTGMGGTSIYGHDFEDEIDRTNPVYISGYQAGIVALANKGPNTNSSQFFIMHKLKPLPPNYTIFGRVIKGMEVVDAIANVETDPRERPVTPVRILSARVTEE